MGETSAEHQVTRLLRRVQAGEKQAADDLLPLVYQQLRQQAQRKLSGMPPGQTLQATALVHEAWLRVVGTDDPGWESRAQFFSAAAQAIREILVEQARSKGSLKRDASRRADVDPAGIALDPSPLGDDVLKLHSALELLESRRPALAELVSLRFFAGLAMPDIAKIQDVPLRSLERDWSYARVWLRDHIRHETAT